ncbi:unnamed protein product [Phytomonas sp. EM1]|nr:unnamed protein product [Phytomonas sp. EM1]|eukprot:CCW62422.1 unnamed protein product [Phytomonas sp. isolate EM1]
MVAISPSSFREVSFCFDQEGCNPKYFNQIHSSIQGKTLLKDKNVHTEIIPLGCLLVERPEKKIMKVCSKHLLGLRLFFRDLRK